MTRVTVAIIGGGTSNEHDVSLASAAAAASALDPGRYEVVSLTIDRDGRWLDSAGCDRGFAHAMGELSRCDVVLPLVHGPHGEDGQLAALCESADVPYAGSGVAAGAIAMDKHVTKLLAETVGVATAPGILLDRSGAHTYTFTGPVVVKPVASGSSVGVALVSEESQLAGAIRAAFEHDTRVLVEDVIMGREIDVAVMRRVDGSFIVSPALEIRADGLFDTDAKYGGSADFVVPAQLDDVARTRLEDAALSVYQVLGCAGLARIDFFVTSDGPVLIEANTTPGFTAQSQVPRMFDVIGIDYSALLDLLIEEALSRPRRQPAKAVIM
ncbi:D-alanine--D-alanine ligase family protein [Paramicrobacterium chengjingii]|uniref:D-alanine--D-alanine ligase family protein n=1 Tax=Paramicrobacterium chengjingii TaxID=2769067 RepID=UPI00141EAB2F|nr:D-alanine--D-alanine ligase [Microbacterium chengjingii]